MQGSNQWKSLNTWMFSVFLATVAAASPSFSSWIFSVKFTVSQLKAPSLLTESHLSEDVGYNSSELQLLFAAVWRTKQNHELIFASTHTQNRKRRGSSVLATQADTVWELQGFSHWSRCVDTIPPSVIYESVYALHSSLHRIALVQLSVPLHRYDSCQWDSPAAAGSSWKANYQPWEQSNENSKCFRVETISLKQRKNTETLIWRSFTTSDSPCILHCRFTLSSLNNIKCKIMNFEVLKDQKVFCTVMFITQQTHTTQCSRSDP